ncbi:MAG: SDR family NAD(P)-dependent oxidoreductase [Acidimicrobiales bacterium]
MAGRPDRFAGKTAVVVGGSSGIGYAVATALVAEGAYVVACARSSEKLAALQANCPPGALDVAVVDVRDHEALGAVIEATSERRGALDVLVYSAGVAFTESVLDISRQTWDETIATNLTGAFFASQAAAREMVRRGGGSIVHISSIDAFVAESPFAHYNASKAGLCQLTRSMAFELGHLGVRCNAVCPGHTRTPMTVPDWDEAFLTNYVRRIPLRRVAEPEEQAAVALFLASEEASYVNGETVVVDGGQLKGFWYRPSLEPPVPPMPPPYMSVPQGI